MADSPLAREPSPAAPRPASPEESTPQATTTTAAPLSPPIVDESTPLLSTNANGPVEEIVPHSSTSTTLYHLTAWSLGFSVIIIVFYLVISGMIEFGSFKYHLPYTVDDGLKALLILVRTLLNRIILTIYAADHVNKTT